MAEDRPEPELVTRAAEYALRALGVSATIELPPAGTLSGLIRRELTGTVTLALKAPEDLDKVADLISDHAGGVKRDECSGIRP